MPTLAAKKVSGVIRGATPEDASRLAEILVFAKRCAYRPIFQDDLFSFNELRVLDLALRFRDDPAALEGVAIYDDGIVKGMLRGTSDDGRGFAELCECYVDPLFQGNGVGRVLMTEFLLRNPSVILWVIKKNCQARRFYEAFGFQPDGTEQLVTGTDVIEMRYRKG